MAFKLSLDSGRFATKRAYFRPSDRKLIKMCIPTLFVPLEAGELSGNSLRVEYQNGLYAVGGSLPYELIDENSKLVFSHELCVYTSIAQTLIELGMDLTEIHEIDLSINLPLSDFKTNREAYEKKYLTNEVVEIKVEGQTVRFLITRVRSYYEGMGALIRYDDYRKGLVGVVDIGGKNSTIIFYEDFKPIRGMNAAGNEGSLVLFEAVARGLSSKYDTDFTIQQVEKMAHGEIDSVEGFEELMNEHGKALAISIRNKIISFKQNRILARYFFTGGGSLVLQPYLEEAFKDYNIHFSKNPQYDNSVGALLRMWREREK